MDWFDNDNDGDDGDDGDNYDDFSKKLIWIQILKLRKKNTMSTATVTMTMIEYWLSIDWLIEYRLSVDWLTWLG